MYVKVQEAEIASGTATYIYLLEVKISKWNQLSYFFSSLNVHNVTRVTDLKLQSPNKPKDSCCPLSLAVTAQRTLSAKWDIIKEDVAEAHFLYYSLLNLDFLMQHLKA